MQLSNITIKQYLDEKGIKYAEHNGELVAKCLFSGCDDDSQPNEAHLYFSSTTGQYQCKKCGEEGNIVSLAKHFNDNLSTFSTNFSATTPSPVIKKKSGDNKSVTTITNEEVEKNHAALPEHIRQYLNKRGIGDEIINQYKLGWGLYYGKWWITIPITDDKGKWIFFKLRKDPNDESHKDKMKAFPVGSSHLLYNSHVLQGNLDYVVICEGEFDALVLTGKGILAVTSTGGAATFKLEWLKSFLTLSKVYICYDSDDAGKINSKKVIGHLLSLPNAKVFSISLPEMGKAEDGTTMKDITDFFTNYGGTKEALFSLAKEELKTIKGEVLSADFHSLTPAQDFIGEYAYLTIPQQMMTDEGLKDSPYVLRSDAKKLSLDVHTLMENKLYTDRSPATERRWSDESVEKFISTKGQAVTVVFAEIVNTIIATMKKYLDLQNEQQYLMLAYWIIGTYFHRAFYSFPYLHLNGEKESGKTKTLQFLALLSFNAELSASNTPAYTIRVIHHNSATMLMDEVESLNYSKDEESKTVIAILNAGYKKGARVGKAEQMGANQTWTPRKFDAYSPKAFAGIKGLESTLASRCIPVIMVNSTNKIIKNTEIRDHEPKWQEIRDSIYCLVMVCQKSIRESYMTIIDEELAGREWELWHPLLALARVANEDDYQNLRALAIETQHQRKEASIEESDVPKILLALQEMLTGRLVASDFFTAEDIVCCLVNYDSEHFKWLNDEKKCRNKGRWIGNQLRRAGIIKNGSKSVRENKKVVKKYEIKMEIIKDRMKSFDLDSYTVTTDENLPPM